MIGSSKKRGLRGRTCSQTSFLLYRWSWPSVRMNGAALSIGVITKSQEQKYQQMLVRILKTTTFFRCENHYCGENLNKDDFKHLLDPDYEICPVCNVGDVTAFRDKNPLLEEYVDCLHFILSIGNHIDYKIVSAKELQVFFCEVNLTEQFASLFEEIVYMAQAARGHSPAEQSLARYRYESLFQIFIGLGVMLDFTTEQIEAAYMEKNAVNHQRQEEGY